MSMKENIRNTQSYWCRYLSAPCLGNNGTGLYKDPKENHTSYAYTWVYSPKDQEVGLWAEFQNYSRSEMDLAPLQESGIIKAVEYGLMIKK